MINIGDKVICIKSYTYAMAIFYEAKEYEIKNVDFYEGDIFALVVQSDGWNFCRFTIKQALGNCQKFSEYFIFLAEWRNQQIDNILND